MKTNYEQQARDKAWHIARMWYPSNKQERTALLTEAILRELNLAKLLEDAAMLDWLEGYHFRSVPTDQPNTYFVDRTSAFDVRTAIRNAMKEDKP